MTSALKVHVIHALAVQDAREFPRNNRLTCYVITTRKFRYL